MLKSAKPVRGLGKAGLLPSRRKAADSPKASQEGPAAAAIAHNPNPNFVPSSSWVLPQAQPAISQEGTTGYDGATRAANYRRETIPAEASLAVAPPASTSQSAGGMAMAPSTATGTAHAPHKNSENEAQGQLLLASRMPSNQLGSNQARRKRKSTAIAPQSDEATPGNKAKRAKRSKGRSSSVTPVEDLLDVIGKVVEVPGSIFYVKTPGVFYIGDIIKPEAKHKNAVEVRFRDDGSTYWFPAKDVRKWLREQWEREADLAQCTCTIMPRCAEVSGVVKPALASTFVGEFKWPPSSYEAPIAAPEVGGVELEEERLAAQALTDISAGISGGSGGRPGPSYSDTAAHLGVVGRAKESKGRSRLRNMAN